LYAGITPLGGLQLLDVLPGGRTAGPQTGTLKKQGTKIATKPTTSIAGMRSTTAVAVNSLPPAPASENEDPARTPESAIANEAPGIPLFIMVSLDLPTVLRQQVRRSK
jgi:hypothetical protein